jgi:molecular chaperone HscB
MSLSLQATDFELFGVPERFVQDASEIDAQWKRLLREAHPDRFAAQGAAAQRVSMQWAVRINEAHQRLKDPVRRATYLCQRWGADVDAERNTSMPASFLMQQMAWREDLDDAGSDIPALDALLARARESRLSLLSDLAHTLDGPNDLAHDQRARQAVGHIRALMFVERFTGELNQRLAQLEA